MPYRKVSYLEQMWYLLRDNLVVTTNYSGNNTEAVKCQTS